MIPNKLIPLLIFLFVFTAYMTIQGFASQLYGSDLGSNMESTLYATFTVACFFAPAVTNKLGSRLTLFIGTLGYGALVAASFCIARGLATRGRQRRWRRRAGGVGGRVAARAARGALRRASRARPSADR